MCIDNLYYFGLRNTIYNLSVGVGSLPGIDSCLFLALCSILIPGTDHICDSSDWNQRTKAVFYLYYLSDLDLI